MQSYHPGGTGIDPDAGACLGTAPEAYALWELQALPASVSGSF
jgi:hypothetical protein